MPRTTWLISVVLVFAALYLWAVVFPKSNDETGGMVFFAGLGLILLAAVLAKPHQKPEKPET